MFKRKKKVDPRFLFIIIVVAVVAVTAVLTYSLRTDKELNTFESIIKDAVVEVQKIVYMPFKNFGSLISNYTKLSDVLEENKILKSNIEKIDSMEAENIELRQELQQLKKELDIDLVLSDYDYLNATVVSRNSSVWYNNLTIDKGSHNGIKEGMVVINSTGVIGKITNVSTFTSDVKLITTTDTNNKISVSIASGNNKLTGLINGYNYDEGYLEIEGISNTDSVNVGDLVYTSGLGGVFPSGILIGKVSSITTDVYDLSKIINVTPSASFNDINYVTILKRKDTK